MSEAPTPAARTFASPTEVESLLRAVGYLAGDRVSTVVHLAARLGKPVLVEGPAGTGKTELAKSLAKACGLRLIRLQCYEGLDASHALYEWDYRKQLLHIQLAVQAAPSSYASDATASAELEEALFGEQFLLDRPLLQAIRAVEPVVLLVDEVDRLDFETEALLLEVLSEYEVSVPELGTLGSRTIPLVFLTSNGSRDLSEALRRRCLFLHIDYPTPELERQIILARVAGVSDALAEQVAEVARSLRLMDLKKRPSISETIDWARTLTLLGADDVTLDVIEQTASVLLKYDADIATALEELGAA